MGDRGNIVIKDGESEVFLYSHWNRWKLVDDARTALCKGWRWDDPQYLARIVFDVMTEGEHGNETGYGISARIGDGDRTVVIDCGEQTVTTSEGERPIMTFIAEKAHEEG